MLKKHYVENPAGVFMYYTNQNANDQTTRTRTATNKVGTSPIGEHGVLCVTPSYELARMRSNSLILGYVQLPKNTQNVDRSKKDFKKSKSFKKRK